jgi:hypothetical protein
LANDGLAGKAAVCVWAIAAAFTAVLPGRAEAVGQPATCPRLDRDEGDFLEVPAGLFKRHQSGKKRRDTARAMSQERS